jgi:hypothetical protein
MVVAAIGRSGEVAVAGAAELGGVAADSTRLERTRGLVTLLDGPFLESFLGSSGNYDNIQFTKAPNVLRGMGLMHLVKNEKARRGWL